jgi:hypothetical protein
MPTTKVLDQYKDEIRLLARPIAGLLTDDDKDFTSALGQAIEKYSADRSQVSGSLHTITDEGSTVYVSDFYAFCKLAAAKLLRMIAVHFTYTGEGSFLNSSFAAYQTKRNEFEQAARNYEKDYELHMSNSEQPRSSRYVSARMGATRDEINARLYPDRGAVPRRVVVNSDTEY